MKNTSSKKQIIDATELNQLMANYYKKNQQSK